MQELSYQQYKKFDGVDPTVRNQLILDYSPLVKYIAQRIATRLPPYIEIDDVINAGVIGLIDAIEKFDSSRNTKFKTYAEFRIKGAILDELRSLDWIPRSVRQKARVLESTYLKLEQKLGKSPTKEEISSAMGIELTELETIINQVGIGSIISIEEVKENSYSKKHRNFDLLDHQNKNDQLAYLKTEELKKSIASAIDGLPEKERLVITLYYYEDLTMKEIGKILKISESRVSQIHTASLLRLKGKLKKLVET